MTYSGHRVQETLIRYHHHHACVARSHHSLTSAFVVLVCSCAFSPEFSTGSAYVYSGSANGRTYVYDLLSGAVACTLGGHSYLVREASWHPHLPLLMSASWDGSVNRYEYREKAKMLEASTASAAAPATSPAASSASS